MVNKSRKRELRLLYYRGSADFWYAAIRLQKERCLQGHTDLNVARADLNFYVVAVQRLREVARMTYQRLRIEAAKEALKQFDDEWPRLNELRNLEEHILGPTLNDPAGIYYFGQFVADLQSGGRVEYIIHVERTEGDVDKLYRALCDSLT